MAANLNSPGTLTWLQAAEHVLREEGPEMHIRDLTNRILEQGMVKSNCATSLETLLYRHTSGGGASYGGRGKGGYGSGGGQQGSGAVMGGASSKFVRVSGKHGWFGLSNPHSLPVEPDPVMPEATPDTADDQNGDQPDLTFEPKAFYSPSSLSQQFSRKRRHSYHSSGGESVSSLSGSDDELGEMEVDGDGSSEFTSDEDEEGVADETLYRKKYTFVKRIAKNIIYENAALANRMSVIREKIDRAQAEKKFLMERLANFEKLSKHKPTRPALSHRPPPSLPRLLSTTANTATIPPGPPGGPASKGNLTGESPHPPPGSRGSKTVSRILSEKVAGGGRVTKESSVASKIQQALSKRSQPTAPSGATAAGGVVSSNVPTPTTSSSKVPEVSSGPHHHVVGGGRGGGDEGGGDPQSLVKMMTGAEPMGKGIHSMLKKSILMSESSSNESSDSDSEGELNIVQHDATPKNKGAGSAKKGGGPLKRMDAASEGSSGQLELAMRCGKVRRLHPIALNSDGTPVFPIVVGGLKVNNLGKIVYDRPNYHSERYILPVGFESSRTYPSTLNPSSKCSYTCKILDGGDNPVFEMVPEDDPAHPIRASSSTACQTIVLKKINKARDKQATNSGSGPEFFGYSNPTILNLLQKMPDAKKCSKYKFVRFAEPNKKSRRSGASSLGGGGRKGGVAKAKRGLKGGPKRGQTSNDSLLVGEGHKESFLSSPSDSSQAIAPILGSSHQYGMETLSYSSSNDMSDGELVIDS